MKHHPKHELLSLYSQGELPAGLSIIIAAHLELCPQCQQQASHMTAHHAEQTFTPAMQAEPSWNSDSCDHDLHDVDFDVTGMIDAITSDVRHDDVILKDKIHFQVKQHDYWLPQALASVALQPQQHLGKLTRSRIELNEGKLKTSLLHIEAGGSVPMHTHKGFEATLLLAGEFSDEMDDYQASDFIWLTGEHQHTPTTKSGCLCLTVSDDGQIFTQGLAKLLNPISQFIY